MQMQETEIKGEQNQIVKKDETIQIANAHKENVLVRFRGLLKGRSLAVATAVNFGLVAIALIWQYLGLGHIDYFIESKDLATIYIAIGGFLSAALAFFGVMYRVVNDRKIKTFELIENRKIKVFETYHEKKSKAYEDFIKATNAKNFDPYDAHEKLMIARLHMNESLGDMANHFFVNLNQYENARKECIEFIEYGNEIDISNDDLVCEHENKKSELKIKLDDFEQFVVDLRRKAIAGMHDDLENCRRFKFSESNDGDKSE